MAVLRDGAWPSSPLGKKFGDRFTEQVNLGTPDASFEYLYGMLQEWLTIVGKKAFKKSAEIICEARITRLVNEKHD